MKTLLALLMIIGTLGAFAQPRVIWGGSRSPNSVSVAGRLPATLSETNLLWEVRLGTHQYAIPTIAGDSVYLAINDANFTRTGARASGGGLVVCLDLQTGRRNWTFISPRLMEGTRPPYYFDQWGCGICSGPVVDGDRLYVVGNRGDILCLDRQGQRNGNDGPFLDDAAYMQLAEETALTEEDGDLIWRFDMLKVCAIAPHDVCGSTILKVDNLLFICTSNGANNQHIEPQRPDAPTLIVLDARTGTLVAQDDAKIGHRIFHGNWCSPAYAEVAGRKMIFFGGGDGFLYAFDFPTPQPGRVQMLQTAWVADCNPAHYREKNGEKIPYATWRNKQPFGPCEPLGTPVIEDGRVYVAIGQSPVHGTGDGCLNCFDAATGKVLWRNETIRRSLATVALADSTVYLPDSAGMLHACDAKNGAILWSAELSAPAYYANAFVADGKVYASTERGDFWVFKAGRQNEVLFKTKLPSPPITVTATEGVLLIPMQNRLRAYSGK